MTFENKSQKAFIAVTLLTVLSIVSVITVYAVLIGTFEGGEVTVGNVGSGSISYSSNGVDWASTLITGSDADSWYARFAITAGGYSGPAIITFQLQNKTDTTNWANVTDTSFSTNSIVLTGLAQTVYATSNGESTGNYDWGLGVDAEGAYRVTVYVNT